MPARRTSAPSRSHKGMPTRGVFCNRTLNLRAIKAIGYDMDYTLIHYRVDEWERRAFEYLRQKLADYGWPLDGFDFPEGFVTRGLVVDTALGNIVKADRFGYVKRAMHGTRRLEFDEQRSVYGSTLVDLFEPRWVFLNTFFSLSEAAMYALLVDRLDEGRVHAGLGYADLWERVHRALDDAHAEGRLKAEITESPERYVDLDPDLPLALLDQRESGKRLLLVTNSDWPYTRAMMRYAIDRFLPDGQTWQSLFDLVVVSASKPEFFSGRAPMFEIVDDDGLLSPCPAGPARPGVYVGGSAALVEGYLGCAGTDILFVGDHLYTDVRVSKDIHRWRTGLIVRELEDEIVAVGNLREVQARLDALMAEKADAEAAQAAIRLDLQRLERGYGPQPAEGRRRLEAKLTSLRVRLGKLDAAIGPIATRVGAALSPAWGPLMSTGLDSSYLAWQLESYADIYMSRVSNLLSATPYAYLRSPRDRMPHDIETS